MAPVTTAQAQLEDRGAGLDEALVFRQRLLDGLSASIVQNGFRETKIADIVRHARTSRRTFYEHFASKEVCFIELLRANNAELVRQIAAAVDRAAPWTTQARQAIEAWIACAESQPAITVSWIREVPALGDAARQLQRDTMEAMIDMVQVLADSDEFRRAGVGPVSRPLTIMLLGGLRELTATVVEDGGRVGDLTEVAVDATLALLGPRP